MIIFTRFSSISVDFIRTDRSPYNGYVGLQMGGARSNGDPRERASLHGGGR